MEQYKLFEWFWIDQQSSNSMVETSRNIFLEGHSDYTITYVMQVYVFVSITIFKNEYLDMYQANRLPDSWTDT